MAKPFDAVEIIESLTNESAEDAQRVAFAILQAVVVGTPVGDPTLWQSHPNTPPGYVGGHARRNWIVSIANTTNLVKGVPGKGGGDNAARSEAISEGTRVIPRFDVERTRLIIQNNVPYITRLNSGHSAQAPANFVEQAVMVGGNVGRNERKDLP